MGNIWPFKKQCYKYGYINNPNWTKTPGHPGKHSPCGYWPVGKPLVIPLCLDFTSMLYPIEVYENLLSEGAKISKINLHLANYYVEESLNSFGAMITGSFWQTLTSHYYTDWPVEGLESSGSKIISATWHRFISHYYDWPIESVESSGSDIISVTLRDIIIRYEEWPLESLVSDGATIIAGTLIRG